MYCSLGDSLPIIVIKVSSHDDQVTRGNKRPILIRGLSLLGGDHSSIAPGLLIVSPLLEMTAPSEITNLVPGWDFSSFALHMHQLSFYSYSDTSKLYKCINSASLNPPFWIVSRIGSISL